MLDVDAPAELLLNPVAHCSLQVSPCFTVVLPLAAESEASLLPLFPAHSHVTPAAARTGFLQAFPTSQLGPDHAGPRTPPATTPLAALHPRTHVPPCTGQLLPVAAGPLPEPHGHRFSTHRGPLLIKSATAWSNTVIVILPAAQVATIPLRSLFAVPLELETLVGLTTTPSWKWKPKLHLRKERTGQTSTDHFQTVFMNFFQDY